MNRLIMAFIIAIVAFNFIPSEVDAAEILNDVKTNAVINKDGTIDIEQEWSFDDSNTKGTEHYINLKANYGNKAAQDGLESITDYEVYRNGELMDFIDPWDIDSSFEEKAGKFSVLSVGGGELELTFGITEKTKNDFLIKYKVHNVIKETNDGYKYMHWTFLPTDLDPEPGNMSANISVEEGLEIEKVFGFNYKGQVEFDKDKSVIAIMDENAYTSNSTLNIFTLIRDNDNSLNTFTIPISMQDKVDDMFRGSDYDSNLFFDEDGGVVQNENGKKNDALGTIIANISSLFFPIIIGIGVIGAIFSAVRLNHSRQLMNSLSDDDKEKVKDKDLYYRDEPKNTELYSDILRHNGCRNMNENTLAYFVSKWTSDGVFELIEEGLYKDGFFGKSKGVKFKVIYSKLDASSDLEEDLFREFYSLADGNRIINTIDLKKMDMSTISKILNSHNKSIPDSLKEKGYATRNEKEPMKFTEEGKDILFQHLGLKNYLEDFTLMSERTASEIELWDYYFHMAAFYGVTDEFKEQLELSIVDKDENSMYNKHYGTSGTALLTSRASKTVSDTYSSHSRSSGGGGSSSMGGGGGSSGGGSGGGTR